MRRQRKEIESFQEHASSPRCPILSSLRAMLPKVDASPKPIVIVFAGREPMTASQCFCGLLRIKIVVADDHSLLIQVRHSQASLWHRS